jgi:hypothetical protein
MRMVEALPLLEPAAGARWCELAPKLFPDSTAQDFLMMLEFYHEVFKRWAADGNPIARDMVSAGGVMLQALVEAGIAGRITGSYLREDGVRAELTPSHWRAVVAPSHGLWRHEVIDLIGDQLVISRRDGPKIMLLGVDIVVAPGPILIPATAAQAAPAASSPLVKRRRRRPTLPERLAPMFYAVCVGASEWPASPKDALKLVYQAPNAAQLPEHISRQTLDRTWNLVEQMRQADKK